MSIPDTGTGWNKHMPAPGKIRKNERLLNLVSFLLKAGRPVSWAVIRRDVMGYNADDENDTAVERRFERDKAALRAMGVPVEYVATGEDGNRGYHIPPGSYFLPRLELSPEEVTVLAFVARATGARAAGPLGEALRTALQKLQFDSPIPGDVRETVEERFLLHHPEEDSEEPQTGHLETMTAAVLAGHTIRFRYRGAGDRKPATRTVDPYGLACWEGHWYLVGRSHERNAVRSFRQDRIRGEVKALHPRGPADFAIPGDFHVQDYVGRPPWEFARAEPVEVAVRFDADVAWMVRQEEVAGDRWRQSADGSAELRRTVTDAEPLLRWLLRFGVHAELLEPVELRARLRSMLEEIRSLYARPRKKRGD